MINILEDLNLLLGTKDICFILSCAKWCIANLDNVLILLGITVLV